MDTKHTVDIFPGWAHEQSVYQQIKELLVAESKPNSLIVLGHSLGALKALQFAQERPEKVRKIILLAGTARFTNCPGYEAGVCKNELKAFQTSFQKDPNNLLERFFKTTLYPIEPGEILKQFIASAKKIDSDALLTGLKELDSLDLRETLPLIKQEVLILHGLADRVVPSSASQYLHKHLPSSRLKLFPNQGHSLFLGDNKMVVKEILSFI